MMGLAIGLLVAFVSYLLNGPADQSVVGAAFSQPLAETGTETRNWVGLVGAYVAHVFVFRWFGIGALALPVIVFLAGYKLTFGSELLPLSRTTTALLFGAVWCSLLLGYIVLVTDSAETASVWCGGIGYETNLALYSLFGWGNLAFITFLLFCFVVYFFDVRSVKMPSFSRPEFPRNQSRTANPLQTYEESEFEPEPEDTNELSDTEPIPDPPQPVNTFADTTPNHQEPEVPLPDVVAQSSGVTLTIKNRDAVTDAVDDSNELSATPAPTFEPDPFEEDDLVATHGLYDPTLDLPQYQYPVNELLTDYPNSRKASVSDDELTANKEKIENTLRNFGIEIDSIQASIGPTVTLYEIIPAKGVRISTLR